MTPPPTWHASPREHQSSAQLSGAPNLSAIFNQVFVGLAEVDFKGKVISANERFCGLLERAPELVVLENLRLRDVLHAADQTACERALGQLGAGLGPVVVEARLMTPDDRSVWVEIAGTTLTDELNRPTSAVLVVTDIGARKRAEARASESERRFREVADAAPVFIWTSGTDRQRRHTWVNTRWAEFRGRPMETELGSGWTTGVHAEDVADCLAAYSAAFDRRLPFTAEYRLRRRDGVYRWMLDTGRPIYDEHGRFVGYIGSSVDITDRKNTESQQEKLLQAERAARSEAEHANRLKDEFLSILSHELRTPLNAVLGWVHLLRTASGGNASFERGLSVIERNARLQSRMVDDLLDMGGVIAGKMRLDRRVVALQGIIDGVAESLEPAFGDKDVALRRTAHGPAAYVNGDPQRLHQIVWNLLTNALKFTPSGGEVAMELRCRESEAEIVISDTGQGIDPEFLPFVFDRFRQGDPSTRRSHGGLGIGLALVKSLTELHGGSVAVASNGPGAGSTFTVALPLADPAERREMAQPLKEPVEAQSE